MYDCHLHSKYSFDGFNALDLICHESLSNGMKGICFTDHIDLDSVDHKQLNQGLKVDKTIDFHLYQQEFLDAKALFAGKLELAKGIEIGLQSHLVQRNQDMVRTAKADFVIGSIHCINGKDIYKGQFSAGKTQQQAYLTFLEETLQLVKTHSYFHVLGHLDMILRDKTFPNPSFNHSEYQLLLTDILKSLLTQGKGIEVNSSGWRYGLNGPHPSFKVIKQYHDLGGTMITTGSDSHLVNSINLDIDTATQLLKEAGYQQISFFIGGKEEKRAI